MTFILIIATLAAAVAPATSLLYATLGEIVGERAGIINLGLEGMMLVGAASACAGAVVTGSPYAGVAAAVIAGMAMNLVFAYAVIEHGANQLAAGLSLLFLGLGASALIGKPFVGAVIHGLPAATLRFSMGDEGAALGADALVVLALPATALVSSLLYRTRWGLSLRATGENPVAAFAAGCNLRRLRYQSLLISGFFAGLAGAHISLAVTYTWAEGMTAGRGFIAIALVIFARWNPWAAVAGAVLFGGAEALQLQLQARGVDVSPFVMNMVPYLLTLAVLPLTKRVGRMAVPGALGRPIAGVE
jgi:simple sugar transport system permease protein